MIDIGRKLDMQLLMTVVNDELEPLFRRKHAYRTMQSIKSKMSDQHITHERLRLIAANIAEDVEEVTKISERIQAYERRNHLMRKF